MASFTYWVLWMSCGKLLAAKHSTTQKKIIAKYGKMYKGQGKFEFLNPVCTNCGGVNSRPQNQETSEMFWRNLPPPYLLFGGA